MSETAKTFRQEDMASAQANNYLAINLHQLLSRENENVFFSPFSISVAMGMLLCAAEGETASELLSVLGHEQAGIKKDDVASIFEQQMSALLQPNDSYTLSCANSVLSDKNFKVKDKYKDIVTNSFKALMLEVDFVKDSDGAVNQINEWIKEKTNNMIPELVQSLDPSTVLVLLNAVYFKGTWMKQFKKEATFAQSFYNKGEEGNAKEVEMMHMKDSFPFHEDPNFQALQLPYIGEEIAMLFILPRERNGLDAVEATLSISFLEDLKKKLRKQKVDITLPRFRLEYTKSLMSSFSELGVKRAFSRGADFTVASDSPDLAVSEILHKAVLEVNEEGSEAAAATMVNVDVDSLIQGNNQLAINLHKALARDGKNAFFSPCSISSVLSMLLYGTRGNTETELRICLGYTNLENDVLAKTFQTFISSLNDVPNDYSVSYANSIVIQKDFEVEEQYKADLTNYFKALCLHVDFVNESKAAVDQINNWVKENSNNMIPRLLDSLDNTTVMVLLNAVYFKGFWLKKFKEKSTFMQYFYNNGIEDEAPLVEMMHLSESFLFVEKESYKVLELPYKGEEIAMLIFLPSSREGLHEMEDLLTPNFISETKEEMRKQKIEVALPKFKLEYSKDLKGTFEELGVKEIFQCGADFGRINPSRDLVVSQIFHKAVLEVNEDGCEAAAATAAVMMLRAMHFTPEFIADHPFAFVIYNTMNNLILFMGRVTEL